MIRLILTLLHLMPLPRSIGTSRALLRSPLVVSSPPPPPPPSTIVVNELIEPVTNEFGEPILSVV